ELEAGFACSVGERLDAAVVRESGAIERDPLDTGRLRLLGDALADNRCRGDVAALARGLGVAAQRLADVGLERRCAREDALAVVGDDAGVDVQVGPVHGQPRDALQRDAPARLLRTARALVLLGQHLGVLVTSSWFPWSSPARPRSECPCPCRARADAPRGLRQR